MDDVKMKSAFTAEEIADAFRSFDIEADVVEDLENPGEYAVYGYLEDLPFQVSLHGTGPFYEEALFMAFAPTSDNPIEWANEWNADLRWTTATPLLNDDGTMIVDEGDFYVAVHRLLSFYGGIHPEALRSLAGQCLLDFVQIYGLDDDLSDEDEDDMESTLNEDSLRNAVVSLLQSGEAMTARQIAKSIDFPKVEVNALLYRRPDLFQRRQANPPQWTLNKHD